MLEPHPVWTTLGLVKLLFSGENSRHFYMRLPRVNRPLLPFILVPCQFTHAATRSV